MILKIVGIIAAALIIGAVVFAKSKGVSPLSWKMHKAISQKNKVAIGGFDPVNYFKNGTAKEGNTNFTYSWKDAKWHFINQSHLDTFKEAPQQYEPQFGGWCAFAVSKGFTATPDPNAWLIHEGKLYLFADEGVKKQWAEQLPEVLESCTKKWNY